MAQVKRSSLWARGAARLRKLGERLKHHELAKHTLGRRFVDALLLPHDVLTMRRSYASVFGAPPRLLRPRTFNEKLQHSKIFNRKPWHCQFADKIAVRDLVRERVGPEVLTQIFWIGQDVEDARKEPLPNQFVIKANHSCGAILLVENVSCLDWDAITELGRRWLSVDYSTKYGEWEYRWIQPKLFIEEYLKGPNGKVPFDYKFFCFHGKVELVQVDIDRFGDDRSRAFFDRDFCRSLPFARGQPRHEGRLAPPEGYQKMLEIAESLAAREPFLRVDLYDAGRPVFGELTLHPHAGHGDYEPAEWDARLGALWR